VKEVAVEKMAETSALGLMQEQALVLVQVRPEQLRAQLGQQLLQVLQEQQVQQLLGQQLLLQVRLVVLGGVEQEVAVAIQTPGKIRSKSTARSGVRSLESGPHELRRSNFPFGPS
jgi:hypothetical protein